MNQNFTIQGKKNCINNLVMYNKSLQNFQLRRSNIYHVTVAVDQESGGCLAGWYWLSISHESECWLAFDWAWSVCWRITQRLWQRSQFLATILRRPQFLTVSLGLLEYPHDITSGFSENEWSERQSKTEATMPFMS